MKYPEVQQQVILNVHPQNVYFAPTVPNQYPQNVYPPNMYPQNVPNSYNTTTDIYPPIENNPQYTANSTPIVKDVKS